MTQNVGQVRRIDAGIMEPGEHSLLWDGKDQEGKGLCSGAYSIRLKVGPNVILKKSVLLK